MGKVILGNFILDKLENVKQEGSNLVIIDPASQVNVIGNNLKIGVK